MPRKISTSCQFCNDSCLRNSLDAKKCEFLSDWVLIIGIWRGGLWGEGPGCVASANISWGRDVLFAVGHVLHEIYQPFQRDCRPIDWPHQEKKNGGLEPTDLDKAGRINVQQSEDHDGDSPHSPAARLITRNLWWLNMHQKFQPVQFWSKTSVRACSQSGMAAENWTLPNVDTVLLDIIWAVSKWRHYLSRSHSAIPTVHESLKNLPNQWEVNRRVWNWIQVLQAYDCGILHIAWNGKREDCQSKHTIQELRCTVDVRATEESMVHKRRLGEGQSIDEDIQKKLNEVFRRGQPGIWNGQHIKCQAIFSILCILSDIRFLQLVQQFSLGQKWREPRHPQSLNWDFAAISISPRSQIASRHKRVQIESSTAGDAR